MLRLLLALLLTMAGFAASPARADPSDIAAASRAVVRVVLIADHGDGLQLVGHGSGFAIAPDLIVTNAHVVRAAREMDDIRIGVVPPQGEGGAFARIVAFSPGNDLALLRLVDRLSLPALALFTGPVEDGADVHAVGYPGNVDMAQGLNERDIVSPTMPVKTRGNVSAGRSSKQFETILHNAAIGAGNSGGPLLDDCGRVIGANTFGTISDGTDSEFYFAVSVREIMQFLRQAGVSARTTGIACRSMADADRAEAERLAGERASSEQHQRSAEEARRLSDADRQRNALFAVLTARENGLALAGLALVLALAAGCAAFALVVREHPRSARIAGGVATVLVLGAIAAWLSRPGFGDLESRAAALAETATTQPAATAHGKTMTGKLMCTAQLASSRVTVSETNDIGFDWSAAGCADGKTQFALSGDGWSRITADPGNDTVTRTTFDAASGRYVIERYFPDIAALRDIRNEAGKLDAATCAANEESARKLADPVQALAAKLPSSPNERLVYSCSPVR